MSAEFQQDDSNHLNALADEEPNKEIFTMKHSYFSSKISKDQAKDTGMAMVLILLLLGAIFHNFIYIKFGIFGLIITMAIPLLYKPVAIIWLGLSHVIGAFASKIILSSIFFLIVSPIGLIRRLLGYDTLKLRRFKAGTESVMVVRNHTFKKEDITKPY